MPASLPPVTWLLPVRNAMPYLPHTLRSISEQTYCNHQILAWDNGSTDGTVEELRGWIPARIPGRVVTNQPMGLGASLARMVEEAPTELCARIDGDDVNLPDRLERQVRYMRAHQDVAVLGSAAALVDEQGRTLDAATPIFAHDSDIRWMIRFGNTIIHPTVMLRRSAVLAAGNYRDIMPGQDYDLWLRMAMNCQFALLPEALVRYRVHTGSVCGRHRSQLDSVSEKIREPLHDLLFPNLSVEQVRHLVELVRSRDRLDVRLRDCLRWWALAGRAANVAGERAQYFRNGSRYRRDIRNLLTRWLKSRAAVAPLWPAIRFAAHVARPVGKRASIAMAGGY